MERKDKGNGEVLNLFFHKHIAYSLSLTLKSKGGIYFQGACSRIRSALSVCLVSCITSDIASLVIHSTPKLCSDSIVTSSDPLVYSSRNFQLDFYR